MKLTEQQFEEARQLYKNGWTLEKLSAKYGCSVSYLYHNVTPNGMKDRERYRIMFEGGQRLKRQREEAKAKRAQAKLKKEKAE